MGATELGPGRLRPAFVTELGPTELCPSELGPTEFWPGLRSCGAPEGCGAQNYALFFSISRSHFRSFFLSLGIFSCLFFSLSGGLLVSFFSLSGGLLVEFWWCFGRPGPSNVRVFALGLSCESPRRPAGRRGSALAFEQDV